MAHVQLFDTTTGQIMPVIVVKIDKGLMERLSEFNMNILHSMPVED